MPAENEIKDYSVEDAAKETEVKRNAKSANRESRLPWRRAPKLSRSFMDLMREQPLDVKAYKKHEAEMAKREMFQNKMALKRIEKEYKNAVKRLDKKHPDYAKNLAGLSRERQMQLDVEGIIKIEQAENRNIRTHLANYSIREEKLAKTKPRGTPEFNEASEELYQSTRKYKKAVTAANDRRTKELGEKYPELVDRVDLTGRKLLEQRNLIRLGQLTSNSFDRVEIYNRNQVLSEGDHVRIDKKALQERERQINGLAAKPQRRRASEIKQEITTVKAAQKLTDDPAKSVKTPEKTKDLSK